MQRRLNTSLQSQGAEFLALGNLLVQGIQAHKAYVNHPNFDILAVNAETGRNCRISVKSRYASDFDGGFPIKSLECEFFVLVALNQGNRYSRKSQAEAARPPDYWVVPVALLKAIRRGKAGWHKVYLRDIEDVDAYREQWSLIAEYLEAV